MKNFATGWEYLWHQHYWYPPVYIFSVTTAGVETQAGKRVNLCKVEGLLGFGEWDCFRVLINKGAAGALNCHCASGRGAGRQGFSRFMLAMRAVRIR